MRIAAIICEYNPFHGGHRYQIEAVRARLGADAGVLCLMSGNYVQRGEPAIQDKWTRAEAAVRGGADLVLELPLTAAVNAAGYFAAGGVDCLEKLGCVTDLCFGTEGPDMQTLRKNAGIMETEEYEAALRKELNTGVSFARARELALTALGGDGAVLPGPNNALGVDYIRRLLQTGSQIIPVAIPRREGLPSASELRRGMTGHRIGNGERAMLSVLRTLPEEAFSEMPFGSEGLWSKVMRACRNENSIGEILAACKSKRYAMSRLKRMLLCLYLGLSREDLSREIPYLRVLAFSDRGRQILRTAKETSELPLVSGNLPDTEAAAAYFAMECRATDLYGLFAPPGTVEPAGREKTTGPVYVR